MNPLPTSDIPSDIVMRITTAADQLYEESGRSSFPNVDTVRRRARADMNATSTVMRSWRRAQTAAAAPLPGAIPDAVQLASHNLLTAVWVAANNNANANLQTAQAGWEQERAEAEACRQQLATAFDCQTEELALAQRTIDAMKQTLTAQANELQGAIAGLEKLGHQAATAEARSNEIVKRADDLKSELARSHALADQERIDSKARENDMREELARLRGQVDAMATERQALLTTLKSNGSGSLPATRATASKAKPQNNI